MSSSTIVDFPKIAQMLDNGWVVHLARMPDSSRYVAAGRHPSEAAWRRARERIRQAIIDSGQPVETADFLVDADFSEVGEIDTDDFTPEQALTRLSYKVHGEII